MQDAVSVVIPTLNEVAHVRAAIESVRQAEVIVVDGGSQDGTATVAERAGARVIRCDPGRGRQLDAGARTARGRWIVFLHADTRLEAGWAADLECLPDVFVGGAFRFRLDPPRPGYRWIEAGVGLRCRLLRLPYGDQAIFARRSAYDRAGGFPDCPILEDVDFIRHLGRLGPLAFPARRAFTSARRWEQRGLLATTVLNGLVLALGLAGCPRQQLARLYGRVA
jgi:rSAM/selenodomain-associated transferase 2